jgi:hypothetical protein
VARTVSPTSNAPSASSTASRSATTPAGGRSRSRTHGPPDDHSAWSGSPGRCRDHRAGRPGHTARDPPRGRRRLHPLPHRPRGPPALRHRAGLRLGPNATGAIEGVCRHTIADRLAITGSRWGPDSSEAILKLRALKDNGDLEEYRRHHLAREHERLCPTPGPHDYRLTA